MSEGGDSGAPRKNSKRLAIAAPTLAAITLHQHLWFDSIHGTASVTSSLATVRAEYGCVDGRLQRNHPPRGDHHGKCDSADVELATRIGRSTAHL